MSVNKANIVELEQRHQEQQVQTERPVELELEVLKEISEVMRDDPAVSTAMDVARQTPDIFLEVQPMLTRRDEFEEIALQGEVHRTFTPLFAGLITSKRARVLMELAMEEHTENEAGMLWELIREGNVYTSELVVGSGVHAAIYNAERLSNDPAEPALTVELSENEGGQFAAPEGPVFRTNTRTRPEDTSTPNVPGTHGSLNHFEGPGVLQQADITGSAYGTQDTLGLPVRINHLLYSMLINETEVVQVSANEATESGVAGKYAVTLRRKSDGEEVQVITDRLVFASGLGEPKTGFEKNDQATQDIVNEEIAKAEAGEDSQIMSFAQFASRVGDESDPFPLRKFGWVAVIGAGDSGAAATEYLLGYGPDPRLSTAQLDRVNEVFWIGQEAQTREQMAQSTRLRYIGIAQEMPLEGDDEYAHRISPITGRAYKVERTEDGRLRIYHGTKNEDGTFTPGGDIVVDHAILTTGFNPTTDKICKDVIPAEGEKEEQVEDESGWAVAKRFVGTEIYKIGPAAELLVSDQDAQMSPAIKRGKEIGKTVAVWASSEETAAAARILGSVEKSVGAPESLTTIEVPQPKITLPEIVGSAEPGEARRFVISSKEIHSKLPYDVNSEDVTRLSVGASLQKYEFPATFGGLSLEVKRVQTGEGEYGFELTTSPELPEDSEYSAMLTDMISEPILQAVVVRLTEKAVHSSQTLVLDIPTASGKVQVSEVDLRVKRR